MHQGHSKYRISFQDSFRVLAWAIVILFAINAFYFTLCTSNPIIQADDWSYLDSFIRKAIDGTLGLRDFFLKRSPDDHAEPLYKLLLLVNYRYFDLDFTLGTVVGFLGAFACSIAYYWIAVPRQPGSRKNIFNYLCWITISALIFSLNSTGIWTWPLVVFENITILTILLFVITTWYAFRAQRYLTLFIATLLLGISSDDSALIAVLATTGSLCIVLLVDRSQRPTSIWKAILVIGASTATVRLGYGFLSTTETHYGPQFSTILISLSNHLLDGGWWKWLFFPLVLPVYSQNPFASTQSISWNNIQAIIAILLLTAHVLFWRRAMRIKYKLPTFTAISLMLLTYGWVAGIIFWRVSQSGNDYMQQPRYVLLYGGHLIALLLMWVSSLNDSAEMGIWRRPLKIWLPAVGCLILLAIQVPQSFAAWHTRKYDWAYYREMANQIGELANNPAGQVTCPLVQPTCNWPHERRKQITELLSDYHLNVFSPRVQRWHGYLPNLQPLPDRPTLHPSSFGPSIDE